MLRYSINQLFPSIYLCNNISPSANYALNSTPIISTNYYASHPIAYPALAPIVANNNYNFYSMPTYSYNLNPHPSYPIYISSAPTVVYQSNIYPTPPLMAMSSANIFYHPPSSNLFYQNFSQPNFPSAPAVLDSQMPNPPIFSVINPSLKIQTHAQIQTKFQTQTQITTQSKKIDVGTQTYDRFEEQINQRMSGGGVGSIPLPIMAKALLVANKKQTDNELPQLARYC